MPDSPQRAQPANGAPQVLLSAEVERLLAEGRVRRALDVAKVLHKACASRDSEALLVRVYRQRIDEMLRQGLANEAQTLAALVAERYPPNRDARPDPARPAVPDTDNLIGAVARLAAPELAPEERARIEAAVRSRVADPRLIANSERLSVSHPLRQEAVAIVRALAAVTAGPVSPEPLTLAEVSRRSPLAPWKMLVRALAHFHARQDAECRHCLAAMAPDSAPARLVPLLEQFLDGRVPDASRPKWAALGQKVVGNTARLRQLLAGLDAAFRSGREKALLDAIDNAARETARQRPELLQRLRQHISVSALMAELAPHKVVRAMGGVAVKDAYFWRLYARAFEVRAERESYVHVFEACSGWEEFRRHAVHQGWFAAGGPEEAALFLHLIELLQRVPADVSAHAGRMFEQQYVRRGGMAVYYRTGEQPPAVMACRPPATPDAYFVHPEELFARAAIGSPTPVVFQRWLDWTRDNDMGGRAEDRAAEAWHRACPDDPRPLLVLMENAEARDAFGKALKYLTAAEALNTMNADVRRARVRLLVATAMRHLSRRQLHLVAKDMNELAALPAAAEGDRPALLEALRWMAVALAAPPATPDLGLETLTAVAGDRLTACFLAYQVAFPCKAAAIESMLGRHLTAADLDSPLCLRAAARARLLCEDLHLRFGLAVHWVQALLAVATRGDANLTEAQLESLARFAVSCKTARSAGVLPAAVPLAYALAGHGLRRVDADHARFLLLRGKSLLIEDAPAPDRGLQCLRAARLLAARRRDMALVEEAMDAERRYRYRARETPVRRHDDGDHLNLLSAEELQRLLAFERETVAFPAPVAVPVPYRPRAPSWLGRFGGDQAALPGFEHMNRTDDDSGRNRVEPGAEPTEAPGDDTDDELFDDLWDDDDLDGDETDADVPPGMAPTVAAILAKLQAKYGPNTLDLVMNPDRLQRKEPQLYVELMNAVEAADLDAGAEPPFPFPSRRRR